jgi:hypothetical protein
VPSQSAAPAWRAVTTSRLPKPLPTLCVRGYWQGTKKLQHTNSIVESKVSVSVEAILILKFVEPSG